MNGSTTNITIRMDANLKVQAEALFNELGMNLSTAFNIFVRQSLREGAIPFKIHLERPNAETIAAMEEAKEQGKGAVSLRGKMIDAPIVERARQVLEAAAQIGGMLDE